jgi:hypothetical protein
MKRHRPGLVRLGIGLAVLWFVFWTFGYVMRPHASDNPRVRENPFSLITQLAMVIAVGFVGPWVIAGFQLGPERLGRGAATKLSELDPANLYTILRRSWSRETGGKWLASNPARGQCSVTAIVAQDLLGGDILKTEIGGQWHFYNLINGRRWDLTVSQFDTPIGYADLPSSRKEALSDTSLERCRLLRNRVLQAINA